MDFLQYYCTKKFPLDRKTWPKAAKRFLRHFKLKTLHLSKALFNIIFGCFQLRLLFLQIHFLCHVFRFFKCILFPTYEEKPTPTVIAVQALLRPKQYQGIVRLIFRQLQASREDTEPQICPAKLLYCQCDQWPLINPFGVLYLKISVILLKHVFLMCFPGLRISLSVIYSFDSKSDWPVVQVIWKRWSGTGNLEW